MLIDLFCSDGLNRLGLLALFGLTLAFAGAARPNVKSPVGEHFDFPRAPNPFAFAETAIKHIVRPNVTFGPITFAVCCIISATNQETPDIVIPIAADRPLAERELEIHAMPITGPVIVKARPGSGGE
jgi:hypothetical protein